jgi:hypothetical protein
VDLARIDPERGFGALHERVAPAIFAWASLHLREPLRARLEGETQARFQRQPRRCLLVDDAGALSARW